MAKEFYCTRDQIRKWIKSNCLFGPISCVLETLKGRLEANKMVESTINDKKIVVFYYENQIGNEAEFNVDKFIGFQSESSSFLQFD